MAYKTNAKALRLGISHDWFYSNPHGSMGLGLLQRDERLTQLLSNLVHFVVPPAPRSVKTKGLFVYKEAVLPGLPGKVHVVRSSHYYIIFFYFYLNVNAMELDQRQRFFRGLSSLRWALNRDLGIQTTIYPMNYFYIYRVSDACADRMLKTGARDTLEKFVRSHPILAPAEQSYAQMRGLTDSMGRGKLRRWRRQRYYQRALQPLVCALLFDDLDLPLAARVIAFELQLLRINHKHFLRFVHTFLSRAWQRQGVGNLPWRYDGLCLKLRGRFTDRRRQMPRSTLRIMRWGSMKRSSLAVEASSTLQIALSRYGAISVQLSYQRRASREHVYHSEGYQKYHLAAVRAWLEKQAATAALETNFMGMRPENSLTPTQAHKRWLRCRYNVAKTQERLRVRPVHGWGLRSTIKCHRLNPEILPEFDF